MYVISTSTNEYVLCDGEARQVTIITLPEAARPNPIGKPMRFLTKWSLLCDT